jgi:uncharacterized repeat protein (TIGR04138 family)
MTALRDLLGRLSGILKNDPRYHQEAYVFVVASLGRALCALEAPRHLTGADLLAGIRDEASEQFGPMAATVFEHWGVKNSLDFGMIVFNMVHEGILSKTETDTLEDFKDEAFFSTLFHEGSGYRMPDDEKSLKKALK